MLHTISARQLQREYKRVLERANKIDEPLLVMSNNKPQGAVIGLELVERLRLEDVAQEAMDEYRQGKTLSIKNKKELDIYLKELEKSIEND